MKREYEEELERLTPRQWDIVVGGLTKKLRHHEKTGHLSYAYDVCPVCKDVGSTLEVQRCGECYIEKSCQAPFTEGFKEDTDAGVAYFSKMRRFLVEHSPPKTIIVGGTWDEDGGRPSKVVEMLGEELGADWTINGGTIENLVNVAKTSFKGYPLIIWMPNIPNGEAKVYPKKDTGAILVCSKVMREGYTKADSVSRIFAMHANAVIEIHRGDDGRFSFGLRDAMANWWAKPSTNLVGLCQGIMGLYWWTKGSVRVGSVRVDERTSDLGKLVELTKVVADRVENSIGERYFGNISTRCQSMFPGAKTQGRFYISPRNVDKRRIEVEDMVLVTPDLLAPPESVMYWGDRKPSVDAPVQLRLFHLTEANYFIHGHARVKGALTTEHYYPCGDMREVPEVVKLMGKGHGAINLRNHGFLLYARTIEDMATLVEGLEIEEPN